MTRLEKAEEALRLLDEAESAMIARETDNIRRLFAPKRKMVEWELNDAKGRK
jgi:hypothetical protein